MGPITAPAIEALPLDPGSEEDAGVVVGDGVALLLVEVPVVEVEPTGV
jgi:hypothetical protein